MKKYTFAFFILIFMLTFAGCYLDDFSSGFGGSSSSSKEGINYELSEDQSSYYVAQQCTFNGSDLVIPDTYNGLPVTEIKSYAFYECPELSSVTIGKNIKNIETNAFYECHNIKSIVFNAVSCNDFNTSPFDGLGGEIHGGASVTIGKDVERIPNYLFGAGEFDFIQISIGSLSFESGSLCREIGDYAFSRSFECDKLVLPEGVETVGEKAFYSATDLLQVTLPQSLTTVGYDAFLNCSKLVEVYNLSPVNIQMGNMENGRAGYYALAIHDDLSAPSVMTQVDDFFFVTKEWKNYLLAYVGGDINVTLPENYQGSSYGLYDYAFYYSDIESIVIPSGVNSIGFFAFGGCTDLKYATFEDPYGWKYGYVYTEYSFEASALSDSVMAAQMLGGGSSLSIYSYDTERWYK